MVQALTERPPYVTFETRSIEDRDATIKAGVYVGRDVDYALITPAGSKDRIERIVTEWFDKLRDDQAQQRVPPEWVNHFRQAYENFQKGQAAPIQGYPVRDWPGLTPSQAKTLQSLHLLAVEDVATANEETIGRLGMGGRALKQRAIDFLATARDVGKVAEEASAARQENAQMKSQIEELMATVAALKAAQAASGGHPATMAVASSSISASDLFDGATPL